MHPSLQLWLGSIVPFTVGLAAWQITSHIVSLPNDEGETARRWDRWVLPGIAYNTAMHVTAIVLAAWIDAAHPGSFAPGKYAEGVVVMGAILVAVELRHRSTFPLLGAPPLPRWLTALLSAAFLTPWLYIVHPAMARGVDGGRLYVTAIALTFTGLATWQSVLRACLRPAARAGSRKDRRWPS